MKITHPEVRRQLLAMESLDQKLRRRNLKTPSYWDPRVDERNTIRMKKIVRRIGWPTFSKVGRRASHAAWLLVQHADHDVAFQKECLEHMRYLKKLAVGPVKPEFDHTDLAYLEDRICVNEKRPQVYGTQYRAKKGVIKFRPIWRRWSVDSRRKEVGLEPLSEYRKRSEKKYAPFP